MFTFINVFWAEVSLSKVLIKQMFSLSSGSDLTSAWCINWGSSWASALCFRLRDIGSVEVSTYSRGVSVPLFIDGLVWMLVVEEVTDCVPVLWRGWLVWVPDWSCGVLKTRFSWCKSPFFRGILDGALIASIFPLSSFISSLRELSSISHVHLTSVNWRTDPFSVVLWGFLLRFGRNGVNFNIKITWSYGFGFDRTFNLMFLTPRHSAELILLTNHSIKLSFHSN